ncbi:metal ABC transporter ATP-binding protein [Calderihabitans maritimus]|uniref:Zinc ABC transporter ZnuC n=1 Tax=Calderihabitans maritimus TaxID=1246530 RepID=A0A1Z5HXY0_9FIRM|nr:ABC transporter ATP-binding protein [Calderihabitans maritimus]GAW94386.1 zinc ABC transporter ZnuC [Calderihabitans maritimus]
MKQILEFNKVSFSYGDKPLLREISFKVAKGDFVALVGPNGSGKSTLLKLALGILKPQQGTVKLFGQDVCRFREWSRVGYVAQRNGHLNPAFPATVEEVIALNLYGRVGPFRRLRQCHRNKIKEVLKKFGLEEYSRSRLGNLSGGQQQKVFIARALMNDPEIVFLDEPATGLDRQTQEQIHELLGRLNQEMGITLLVITHYPGLIAHKVNRLFCLENQRLHVHAGTDTGYEELFHYH